MQTLAQFTPQPAGFDRDTLLFNAGRASVPRRRWLFAVVSLLLLSQATTLVCLWPSTSAPHPPSMTPLPTVEPFPPASPLPPDAMAALWQQVDERGDLRPLVLSDNPRPDQVPLNVRSHSID